MVQCVLRHGQNFLTDDIYTKDYIQNIYKGLYTDLLEMFTNLWTVFARIRGKNEARGWIIISENRGNVVGTRLTC